VVTLGDKCAYTSKAAAATLVLEPWNDHEVVSYLCLGH